MDILQIKKSKYQTLISTNEHKDMLEKDKKIWNKLNILLSWKMITQMVMMTNLASWQNWLSEGINVYKNNDLGECIVCHYNFFFDIKFIFETCISQSCQVLTQKSYKL